MRAAAVALPDRAVEAGYADRVANHSVTSAEAAIPGLSITVPASDRPTMLELTAPRTQATAGTVPFNALFKVYDEANVLVGDVAWETYTALNQPRPLRGRVRVPASAVAKTYTVKAATLSANTTVLLAGSATERPVFDAVKR